MAMESKVNLQCKNIFHLEDFMVMYSIYNLDTLEKLTLYIKCITEQLGMKNLFASKLNQWYKLYLTKDVIGHYVINSLLYFRTFRQKYVKMYEKSISQ